MVARVLVRGAPRGAVPLATGASKGLLSKAIRIRRQLGWLEEHHHDLCQSACPWHSRNNLNLPSLPCS